MENQWWKGKSLKYARDLGWRKPQGVYGRDYSWDSQAVEAMDPEVATSCSQADGERKFAFSEQEREMGKYLHDGVLGEELVADVGM